MEFSTTNKPTTAVTTASSLFNSNKKHLSADSERCLHVQRNGAMMKGTQDGDKPLVDLMSGTTVRE